MSKNSKVENEEGAFVEPLLTRPKKVAIVALGASVQDFLRMMLQSTRTEKPLFDEVWTLNRGLRGIGHDKLFVMDDLEWIRTKKDKVYASWLKRHDRPLITSTVYPEYKMAVAYPLHEVMEFIEDDIFTVNTVSYMVAYAMYIGVEVLSVYGADFFYPGGKTAEEGGQAVAYLLGMAAGRKIMVHQIPASSTLLYCNRGKMSPGGSMFRPPYGYHRLDQIKKEKEQVDKARAQAKKGK